MVLRIVIEEAVKKFWFLLNDSSAIVAADAWFMITAGIFFSIFSWSFSWLLTGCVFTLFFCETQWNY